MPSLYVGWFDLRCFGLVWFGLVSFRFVWCENGTFSMILGLAFFGVRSLILILILRKQSLIRTDVGVDATGYTGSLTVQELLVRWLQCGLNALKCGRS